MKNLVLLSVLMFALVAVNAQEKKTRKEKRAEREAKLVEQTKQLIDDKVWEFSATQMLPAKGRSKSLTTGYNVVIKDNTVNSYLPYFGVAHTASYGGGGDSPMIFEAPFEDYEVRDGRKGNVIIKFKTKNKNDSLEYTFTVSPNGSTTLSVNSTSRQHITYYGDLIPFKEKEKK